MGYPWGPVGYRQWPNDHPGDGHPLGKFCIFVFGTPWIPHEIRNMKKGRPSLKTFLVTPLNFIKYFNVPEFRELERTGFLGQVKPV
jgi:hypothetical protein